MTPEISTVKSWDYALPFRRQQHHMAAAAWHLASSPSRDVIVTRSSLRLRQSKAATILCKRPFYKEFLGRDLASLEINTGKPG